MARTSYHFDEMIVILCVLNQCAKLDFYSTNSLKQYSGIHIAPF